MKVCTDACLLGASVVQKIHDPQSAIRNVLDIGTGTGLLSLMYAQKNPSAIIDAVEIDEAAMQQAKENFEASPWKERLHVYHIPIQQFNTSTRYDLIISNPPFFENDLKSKNTKRNLALHSAELSLEELLNAITTFLKEDGIFALLLPYHRTDQFIHLAAPQSFCLIEKISIKQTPRHNYFRSILLFSKRSTIAKQSEIIIQNENEKYTNDFVSLLKDYYLHL
jgi:tRNA1Val (adenine37-N6)-methyltransferase